MNSQLFPQIIIESPQKSETNINIKYEDQKDRRIILDFELKMLQIYGPVMGIYALPSLNDEQILNAVIFLRNGYYKDARFKFDINLKQFPQQPPQIYFKTSIYHSLICQSTGKFDIDALIHRQWSYENGSMLYTIINELKRSFVDPKFMQIKNSFNPLASKLFQQNNHKFIEECMKSVDKSNAKFTEYDENWSLRFHYQQNQEQNQTSQIKQLVAESLQQNGDTNFKIKWLMDCLNSQSKILQQ